MVMQTTGEGGGELEREVLIGRGSCLFSSFGIIVVMQGVGGKLEREVLIDWN